MLLIFIFQYAYTMKDLMKKLQYLCAFALLLNNNTIRTESNELTDENEITNEQTNPLSFATLTDRKYTLDKDKHEMDKQHTKDLDDLTTVKRNTMIQFQNSLNEWNNPYTLKNISHALWSIIFFQSTTEEKSDQETSTYAEKLTTLAQFIEDHKKEITKIDTDISKLKSEQIEELNQHQIKEQELNNDFNTGADQALKKCDEYLNIKKYEHIKHASNLFYDGYELSATPNEIHCLNCLDMEKHLRSNIKLPSEIEEALSFIIKQQKAAINGKNVLIDGNNIIVSNKKSDNFDATKELIQSTQENTTLNPTTSKSDKDNQTINKETTNQHTEE